MALGATSYVVLGLVSVRPRAGHELARYAERSVHLFDGRVVDEQKHPTANAPAGVA